MKQTQQQRDIPNACRCNTAATALRQLVTVFLVLRSSALREPHNGLVAGRESLASLDSVAPNQRPAFFLCIKANRAGFNGAALASIETQLWSLCLPRQSSCPCTGPVTNLLLSLIT
jgi:hypothetical protein